MRGVRVGRCHRTPHKRPIPLCWVHSAGSAPPRSFGTTLLHRERIAIGASWYRAHKPVPLEASSLGALACWAVTRDNLLTRDRSSPGTIPAYRSRPQSPSKSRALLSQHGGYTLSRYHRRIGASPTWVNCCAGPCAGCYFQDEVVLATKPRHK